MDDYRKPPKANRYWSRPKPKIYECNIRDAERMYQDSYKEYRAEKEFRLRGWQTDSLTDRFAHLRAGPLRREISVQPYSSRLGDSSSLTGRSTSVTKESSETNTAVKSEVKSVPAYDPQKENQSLEERLERLRRLREDLGLPSDTEASKSTLRDSASRTLANDIDSSSYKSERSSRVRARAAAGTTNEDSSSYSFKSERTSRLNGVGTSANEDYKYKSDLSTDDFKLPARRERKTDNITPKFERKTFSSKTDSLNDDLSFGKSEKKVERYSKLSTTASSSSPIRSRKAAAAAAAAAPAADSLDFDDDDFDVAKMMKKLPSSQEILDRISKMELDD